jgi:tetratricopeptide (TPR) repeat protein
MSFKFSFATLIGSILVLLAPWTAQAQSLEAVEAIAKATVVRIYPNSSPGSGVIINKAGNQYTVLTAKHVVEGIIDQEVADIQTPDGHSYKITSEDITVIQDADLALVEFESAINYSTVALSTYRYRLAENRDYGKPEDRALQFSNPEEGKHFIFVAGWPNDDTNQNLVINPGLLVDTSASVVSNPGTRYQTYELVYSNLTYVGMSGGPVFDTQGRLIGIHGRSDGRLISRDGIIERVFLEEEQDQFQERRQIKIGYSLGISTNTFLRLLQNQSLSIPTQVESSPPPFISALDLQRSWQPPIDADPSTPFYWVSHGNQLWRIGLVDQAQQDFDRALMLKPSFYLAAFGKGFVYGFSHDYQNALTFCNRAVMLSEQVALSNPNADRYYDAWRCKAGALQYLGQFPASLEALNEAIQIQNNRILQEEDLEIPIQDRQGFHNPNDFDVQGELLYALRQYNGALAAFDRAISIRKNYRLSPSTLTLNSRALTLIALNRPQDALENLQQAIEIDPGYATAWAHQGEVWIILNQLDQALSSYNRATNLDPIDPYLWTNRGVLLYQMGQCSEALASFEKALQIDPNYTNALGNRQILLEECSLR